jgi:hypothetical protein
MSRMPRWLATLLFKEMPAAVQRNQGSDQCFLCRRTSDEIHEFLRARVRATYKDDPALDQTLREVETPFAWLTYRTVRPLCCVCYQSLAEVGSKSLVHQLLAEVVVKGGSLWPDPIEEE